MAKVVPVLCLQLVDRNFLFFNFLLYIICYIIYIHILHMYIKYIYRQVHVFCHCPLQFRHADSSPIGHPQQGEGLSVTVYVRHSVGRPGRRSVEWACIVTGSLQCLSCCCPKSGCLLRKQPRNPQDKELLAQSTKNLPILSPTSTRAASLSHSHGCESNSILLDGSQTHKVSAIFPTPSSSVSLPARNQARALVQGMTEP